MFMQNADAFHPAMGINRTGGAMAYPTGSGDTGLLASTLVETDRGWHAVGSLAAGDRVQTWDGGLVAVLAIGRRTARPAHACDLVCIPGGSLGACSDLYLMAGQEVLILSPVAEEVLDAAGAFIPARALVGHFGAHVTFPDRQADIVCMALASDEAVYVNSGMLVRAQGPLSNDWLPRLRGSQAAAFLELVTDRAPKSCALFGAA